MGGNADLELVFGRHAPGEMDITLTSLSYISREFAKLAVTINNELGEPRIQTLDLVLQSAETGSLIVRLRGKATFVHQNREMLADYATIFGLPVAFLALVGLGHSEKPELHRSPEYLLLEKRVEELEDSAVFRGTGRKVLDLCAMEQCDYVRIIAPGSPPLLIDERHFKVPKGLDNFRKFTVDASREKEAVEAIQKIEGVVKVESSDSSERPEQKILTVIIDDQLAHRKIEDVRQFVGTALSKIEPKPAEATDASNS